MDQHETPLMQRIKRNAKRLKKATPGMTHSAALDVLAKESGFQSWKDLRDQELGGKRSGSSTHDHEE